MAIPAGDPPVTLRRERFLTAARPELDRLYRMAGLILADAADAEDVVQDALAHAWERFDDLREPDRFRAWLDRIVVNRCRDRLRRRGRIRFVALDDTADPPAGDPFQSFLDRDSLLSGLRRLEPDERIAVVLRYWGDLPLEAIAERMGWPLGTVKSRLHRALRRLRTALDDDRQEAAE
jgi:RNA polymerase sigma-70 factor (ECF subfamily)